MRLDARSRNCFSSVHLLRLDGHSIGEFRGRWFSEGIDVHLIGRRGLHLEKANWMGSHFRLSDASTGQPIAEAGRAGLFTSTWRLQLSVGPAQLVSAGFFNTGYRIVRGTEMLGQVDRLGFCTGDWCVQGDSPLTPTDLILAGLVYHTILSRRRRSNSAASG